MSAAVPGLSAVRAVLRRLTNHPEEARPSFTRPEPDTTQETALLETAEEDRDRKALRDESRYFGWNVHGHW